MLGIVADKIAGSDFEHQRFLLMARRAKYRTYFVTRTCAEHGNAFSPELVNNLNNGELAEWLTKSPGAILNISVFC